MSFESDMNEKKDDRNSKTLTRSEVVITQNTQSTNNSNQSNNNKNDDHDFESLKKMILTSMTEIIKAIEFVSNSIGKIGTKDDSLILRNSINRTLTRANDVFMNAEPTIKKFKGYKVHSNKTIKSESWKIVEDISILEENLRKLNIVKKKSF